MRDAIESAVAVLKQGGIIAYPTEAVFGLGCDPDDDAALNRLLALKQRPAEKGLIIIAASFEQLKPYIQTLTENQKQKLLATWPGRVTWLLPVKNTVSRLLVGQHDSIAARVTAHPIASELCRQYGKPLVSTSANLSGHEPARSVGEVKKQFANNLDYIVDGDVDLKAMPSEIRDLISDKVIRDG
jgi:L-threonylcarbamoyladenylate synthase